MSGIFARYFLAVALAGCFGRAAFAHAFLDKAEPKVGGTVAASPVEVKIWFTDETQPEKCGIEVFDDSGKEIDKKDTHAEAKDMAVLVVTVPSLSAGTYTVKWHAVCQYGHKTSGDFVFKVAAK
jgi:methionine-rich copper-binding protein CopC